MKVLLSHLNIQTFQLEGEDNEKIKSLFQQDWLQYQNNIWVT